MYYNARFGAHCIKVIAIVNCLGFCMFSMTGGTGNEDEWKLFKETPIFENPEKYFELNDRGVLLWDRALSDYEFEGRLLTPYKR